MLPFAPPDQVEAQIDRLVQHYPDAARLHPVIAAAWLHHAFVAIHPFDDGNGRVARALALFVLLRHHHAPLVVDRLSRTEYLRALEHANDGDLRHLVRLFARLEIVARRAELERPIAPTHAGGDALDVARASIERLKQLRAEDAPARAQSVAATAAVVLRHAEGRLRDVGRPLVEQFRELDPRADHQVFTALPPQPEATWWRAHIVRAARAGEFWANLSGGTWWAHLRLRVLGQQLRFVVVTQKVGQGETGVLAVTVFAAGLA